MKTSEDIVTCINCKLIFINHGSYLTFDVPDDIYYNEDQFNHDDRFHIGNGFDAYAPEKFAEDLQVYDP